MLFFMMSPLGALAAPSLTSLSFTPSTVNVSEGDGLCYALIDFSSAEELTDVLLTFTGPDQQTFTVPSTSYQLDYMLTGTRQGGRLRVPVPVSSRSSAGDWEVSTTMTDFRSRKVTYSADGSRPYPEGSVHTIQLLNNGSNRPPVLISASAQPSSVDVSDGDGTIDFTVEISDDHGLKMAGLSVRGPGGSWVGGLAFGPGDRNSGTAQRGVYRKSLRFPAFLKPGAYTIEYSAEEAFPRRYTSPSLPPTRLRWWDLSLCKTRVELTQGDRNS